MLHNFSKVFKSDIFSVWSRPLQHLLKFFRWHINTAFLGKSCQTLKSDILRFRIVREEREYTFGTNFWLCIRKLSSQFVEKGFEANLWLVVLFLIKRLYCSIHCWICILQADSICYSRIWLTSTRPLSDGTWNASKISRKSWIYLRLKLGLLTGKTVFFFYFDEIYFSTILLLINYE